jgi:hypothetical protein
MLSSERSGSRADMHSGATAETTTPSAGPLTAKEGAALHRKLAGDVPPALTPCRPVGGDVLGGFGGLRSAQDPDEPGAGDQDRANGTLRR